MAVTQLGTFIEKQTANLKLKHDLVHSSNFEKDVEGILLSPFMEAWSLAVTKRYAWLLHDREIVRSIPAADFFSAKLTFLA